MLLVWSPIKHTPIMYSYCYVLANPPASERTSATQPYWRRTPIVEPRHDSSTTLRALRFKWRPKRQMTVRNEPTRMTSSSQRNRHGVLDRCPWRESESHAVLDCEPRRDVPARFAARAV